MTARYSSALLLMALSTVSCGVASRIPRMIGKSVELAFRDIRPVENRIVDPVRPDARLAALWVGHATVLIQIEDKFILTDPVFTDTVGQIGRRLVEPGLDPDNLPLIDAVLISHMHFDHLSFGSLERIELRVRDLIVPEQGLLYVPGFSFRSWELARWESWQRDGLRITAVPVRHSGFRYGIDSGWMTRSYTGYVIEYAGHAVYFGGDTGYTSAFQETARRFPGIDVAFLPIAPIEPRDFMRSAHPDPSEAVQAFLDLGARFLVPIHFDTFVNSDDEVGDASRLLTIAAREARIVDRLALLGIGEQRVFE